MPNASLQEITPVFLLLANHHCSSRVIVDIENMTAWRPSPFNQTVDTASEIDPKSMSLCKKDCKHLADQLHQHPVNYVARILLMTPVGDNWQVTWDISDSTNLEMYMKNELVTPMQIQHWFKQLLYSVDSLHRRGIYHGDIRPSALRVDAEGNIRLLKIGFSSTGSEITDPYLEYVPPEGSDTFTESSDVYSLGKVFLFLLHGEKSDELNRYEFNSMPVYSLIRNMTRKNPDKRLRLRDLPADFFNNEIESKLPAIVSEAAPPATWRVRELISKLPISDIASKLRSDYAFLARNQSSTANLYPGMIDLLAAFCEKTAKLPKVHRDDKAGARNAGSAALKAALLYQKTGLYDYAKYCYCRSLLAYHLAGGPEGTGEEALRHYQEVRGGKLVSYANLSELQQRS